MLSISATPPPCAVELMFQMRTPSNMRDARLIVRLSAVNCRVLSTADEGASGRMRRSRPRRRPSETTASVPCRFGRKNLGYDCAIPRSTGFERLHVGCHPRGTSPIPKPTMNFSCHLSLWLRYHIRPRVMLRVRMGIGVPGEHIIRGNLIRRLAGPPRHKRCPACSIHAAIG